jgi:hypothetical protein
MANACSTMMLSAPKPNHDDSFFKKAAVVWQILRRPGGKSSIEVMQLMDPGMNKIEAAKYKMKVSRWAKRLDIDNLLNLAEAVNNNSASSSSGVATMEAVTPHHPRVNPALLNGIVPPGPCAATYASGPPVLHAPPVPITPTADMTPWFARPPPPVGLHSIHQSHSHVVGEPSGTSFTVPIPGLSVTGTTTEPQSPKIASPQQPPPQSPATTIANDPPRISTETNQQSASSIESSSIRFSHGKTRWAELNRSLKHVERVLRADGYKVSRRTKHQMAADRCNQERDEAQGKDWSDEYVARFKQATLELVAARHKDPLNASAKSICRRIAIETNARIQLSEKSVRRAVRNGRAGQSPRKAGKPVVPSSLLPPPPHPLLPPPPPQLLPSPPLPLTMEEDLEQLHRKEDDVSALEHDTLAMDLLGTIGPGMAGSEFEGVPHHHHHDHHHHDHHEPLEEQHRKEDEEKELEEHDPCYIPLYVQEGGMETGVFDGESFAI